MKALAGSAMLLLVLFSGLAQAQQTRDAAFSPNLFGSVSQGTAAANPIPLSIADAIERALKYNLGSIITGQETQVSRAARVRALSELLPKINGTVTETVEQINLAAFGFSSFPGVPSVTGPFSVFDARARFSQTVVDFRFLHELRAATERVNASNYGQQDVRELVVLVATNLYLDAVAAASRVDAAPAQFKTSQ